MLALLFCAACGHVSNQAATAMTVAAAAAIAQLVAPPALEGRTGVCAEYREIRCVAMVLCAHDLSRDCDVCRCAAILSGSTETGTVTFSGPELQAPP
ncbi:MAG TPA: hypothetical protein VE964_04560 [Myxococcales bacterium]|nr:hypothetical protein [Myxococcales bacterium]